MSKQAVFVLMTFLHDLATAVWIGGMIALAAATLPALRDVLGAGPQTKKVVEAIQKRLSRLIYGSIVILLLSGVLLAQRAPDFQGLFRAGNTYSLLLAIKHLLVLAMIGVALARSLWLGKAQGPTKEKLKVALLLGNILLGAGVLLLSAWAATLS
jgi:uncharacterized membrane protein